MKRTFLIAAVVVLASVCAAAQDAVASYVFAPAQAQNAAAVEKVRAQLAQAQAQRPADAATIDQLRTRLEQLVSNSQFVAAANPKMLLSPVTGAPYSAEEVTEFNQTLGDGTRIHTSNRVTVYRDGLGRVRRETPDEITIADPVAGVSYSLNPNTQTARKMTVTISKSVSSSGSGDGAVYFYTTGTVNGAGAATVQAEKLAAAGEAKAQAKAKAALPDGQQMKTVTLQTGAAGVSTVSITDKVVAVGSAKSEWLGVQAIEGTMAQGTRSSETIETGAIGNDRPIQVVNERWFSDELKLVMMTRHSDPRSGEETFRVSNLRRGEPDPSLFQAPASYTLSGLK